MNAPGQNVTVFMPVKNGEAYLCTSVSSILNQTHRDFEFIIVDDGSTDSTGTILAEFAGRDERIRIVQNKQQGIPAAMNQALSLASGDIVFRIDHDDIAWPERIERQLAFLSHHPQVAVLGSWIEAIDRNGWPFKMTKYPTEHARLVEMLDRGINPLASPATAMRRSAILSVGGFHPAFRVAQDFDMWCRISEHYELANLPEILLSYRWHGENISVRLRYEQALAAHIARLAARERRQGRLDPTLGLTALRLGDLDRFDIASSDRAAVLLDVAAAGLVSFNATGHVRYLDEIERCIADNAVLASDPKVSTQIARELAGHLLKAGKRQRGLRTRTRGVLLQLRASAPGLKRLVPVVGRLVDDRCLADWVVRCADPLGLRANAPKRTLPPARAEELVYQAYAHGVLPAVLRHFPWPDGEPAFAAARSIATQRYRTALSVALMLRQLASELEPKIAHLPVAIIKGPVFARTLYSDPSLRLFGDIDLLAAPNAVPQLADVLRDQGFEPADAASSPEAREWKWVHRENAALLVEVQTNLVHAPSLQHAVSLSYEDIAGRTDAPAVQLLVAVIHAGLGAHFEQLRSLVDVCQAARALRTAGDVADFEALVLRTNASFVAGSGLELAGRVLKEPRCFAIAQAIGSAPHIILARGLLNQSVVMSTMTSRRGMCSWRRQAFRYLMKQQRQRN